MVDDVGPLDGYEPATLLIHEKSMGCAAAWVIFVTQVIGKPANVLTRHSMMGTGYMHDGISERVSKQRSPG